MLDNILSNNMAVNLILKTLYPNILVKQRKQYWLQCFSYIVNLYMQAFLLGKKVDITLEELKLAYSRYNFKLITKL